MDGRVSLLSLDRGIRRSFLQRNLADDEGKKENNNEET
jgi:hypothetical protein